LATGSELGRREMFEILLKSVRVTEFERELKKASTLRNNAIDLERRAALLYFEADEIDRHLELVRTALSAK
jgi:hypothetical protein